MEVRAFKIFLLTNSYEYFPFINLDSKYKSEPISACNFMQHFFPVTLWFDLTLLCRQPLSKYTVHVNRVENILLKRHRLQFFYLHSIDLPTVRAHVLGSLSPAHIPVPEHIIWPYHSYPLHHRICTRLQYTDTQSHRTHTLSIYRNKNENKKNMKNNNKNK